MMFAKIVLCVAVFLAGLLWLNAVTVLTEDSCNQLHGERTT